MKLDTKFAILYENTEERRNQVIGLLMQLLSQGVDVFHTPINHPLVSIRPDWPPDTELFALPLNIQCEEMQLKTGGLSSTGRKLVIDAEIVVETFRTPNIDYMI